MANNTFMADDLIAATLVQLLEVQAYKQDSSSSYKGRHPVLDGLSVPVRCQSRVTVQNCCEHDRACCTDV